MQVNAKELRQHLSEYSEQDDLFGIWIDVQGEDIM